MSSTASQDFEFIPSTPVYEKGKWITDGAWISGVVGILTLFFMAILCHKFKWFDHGISLFGFTEIHSDLDIKLFLSLIHI